MSATFDFYGSIRLQQIDRPRLREIKPENEDGILAIQLSGNRDSGKRIGVFAGGRIRVEVGTDPNGSRRIEAIAGCACGAEINRKIAVAVAAILLRRHARYNQLFRYDYENCKTFMRQFDPDPRLQHLLNNLERLVQAGFSPWQPIGEKPKLINRVGSHASRKSTRQLPTQRFCCHVRRSIEDVRVEAEKNIGARVAKAFLRCLERYPEPPGTRRRAQYRHQRSAQLRSTPSQAA